MTQAKRMLMRCCPARVPAREYGLARDSGATSEVDMTGQEEKLDRSIRDCGFGALLCYSFGLVLLEAWLIRLEAKPFAHLLTACGALVAVIAYWGLLRRYRAASQRAFAASGDSTLAFGGVALLAGFGYAGALALASGVITLFAAFAVAACSLPWSRIPLCRTHILPPCALVIGTALLALPRLDQLPHPLLLPLAIWILWLASCGAWLRNVFCKWQGAAARRFALSARGHGRLHDR